MATIVQIIATGGNHYHFDADLVGDKLWHVVVSYPDGIKTGCGVQLEGEDGYAGGEDKQGRVTCPLCRIMIEEFQSVKSWR